MNRRQLLLGGVGALISVSMLATQPAAAQQNDFQVLQTLSAYLNSITTMEGNFVQSAPDGRIAQGKFWLSRPGRLRFEYEQPYSTLVISDGFWAGVVNGDTRTLDRLPLSSTPLYLLLKENVDLTREGAIRRIDRGPGLLRVLAIDPDRPNDGSVTMIFSSNPVELQKWVVTDPQGQSSVIAMRDVRSGGAISPEKFVIVDPNDAYRQ